jgi:hypothetical protein
MVRLPPSQLSYFYEVLLLAGLDSNDEIAD